MGLAEREEREAGNKVGSKVEVTKSASETEKKRSDEAEKPEETSESEPVEEVREQSAYKLFPMELDEIDVYAKKRKPAKRRFEWNWDHKLFYRIEGVKLGGKLIREDNGKKALTLKDFKIRRKVMKNKATVWSMRFIPIRRPVKSIRLCRLKTLKNFLKTALEPVGTSLYIYGGGWDWQDKGGAIIRTK